MIGFFLLIISQNHDFYFRDFQKSQDKKNYFYDSKKQLLINEIFTLHQQT
jgi:hypothetical protein